MGMFALYEAHRPGDIHSVIDLSPNKTALVLCSAQGLFFYPPLMIAPIISL